MTFNVYTCIVWYYSISIWAKWYIFFCVLQNILKILKSWKVNYPLQKACFRWVFYFPWFQDFQNVFVDIDFHNPKIRSDVIHQYIFVSEKAVLEGKFNFHDFKIFKNIFWNWLYITTHFCMYCHSDCLSVNLLCIWKTCCTEYTSNIYANSIYN